MSTPSHLSAASTPSRRYSDEQIIQALRKEGLPGDQIHVYAVRYLLNEDPSRSLSDIVMHLPPDECDNRGEGNDPNDSDQDAG